MALIIVIMPEQPRNTTWRKEPLCINIVNQSRPALSTWNCIEGLRNHGPVSLRREASLRSVRCSRRTSKCYRRVVFSMWGSVASGRAVCVCFMTKERAFTAWTLTPLGPRAWGSSCLCWQEGTGCGICWQFAKVDCIQRAIQKFIYEKCALFDRSLSADYIYIIIWNWAKYHRVVIVEVAIYSNTLTMPSNQKPMFLANKLSIALLFDVNVISVS